MFREIRGEASRLGPGQSRPGSGRATFFLLGMTFMGLVQVIFPIFQGPALSKQEDREAATPTNEPPNIHYHRHKPWGDFEYTWLPLEEPREFLPSTTRPLGAPRWFFGFDSRQKVLGFLNHSGLTEEQREQLFDFHRWQSVSNGFYLSPPPSLVLEMSRSSRELIYSVLDDYPANSAQCHPFRFRPETFDAWLADIQLGQEQMETIRKLVYRQDGSICFSDGAIVQGLFSAPDFNRFVKALYHERTFLMKLAITPETDIDALVRYWDHGGNVQARRPLLESLARLPGGGSINIMSLLPPFPRLRLYTYADPARDPTAPLQNCTWTAMNFFNEKPDNRFLDAHYVQQILASSYEAAKGEPIFGDLIAVQDPSGGLIHLCVYLADDVVFTKNGRSTIEPWVLMKIPDMLAYYRPKEGGQVTVFRPKGGNTSPKTVTGSLPDSPPAEHPTCPNKGF